MNVLFSPGGKRAWGLLSDGGKESWLGRPDAAIQAGIRVARNSETALGSEGYRNAAT
jgi:hypothetical protein